MYESYYNLKKRPFQLSPDPHFFYGSSIHKRAMSYLRYGLTQGEGFIVITGDVGTGKTMLVKTLIKELSQENVIAAQLVTTQLDADDTLRMVAASFGLPHDRLDKATILKNLEMFMTSCKHDGKRLLLLVDEAQNLPPRSLEELRLLSNYQLGEQVLLQSFLLGQPEFRNTLQTRGLEQLRQRVKAAYHLAPLNEEQTCIYIEYRLRTAGWNDDPHFTEEAFALIYEYTGGVPRRINSFCDRLLLFGMLEEVHEFDAEKVKTVMQELLDELSSSDSAELNNDSNDKDKNNKGALLGVGGWRIGASISSIAGLGTGALEPLNCRVETLEKRVIQLEKTVRAWINTSV